MQSLSELFDRLSDSTSHDGEVSVEDLVASVGQRSFAPLLLAPSVLVVTPLSGIPGLPTVCAMIIALVAAQMLLGRDHVWLPRFLARRSMRADRVNGALLYLRPVAKTIDRAIGPRIAFLTRGTFARVIAAACLLTAMAIPPLEILPFTSSVAALTIAVLALAIAAHDGVLAILGLVMLVAGAWLALTVAPLVF